MKYFTLNELCKSATAQKRGIDNTPPEEVIDKLKTLTTHLLDPVRKAYGKPIVVNSAYRSPALNKAVRGATNSQHLKGEAADITTGNKSENKRLFDLIRTGGFVYDQLIDECDYAWIHVSYRSGANRMQVLHLRRFVKQR